MAHRGDVNFSDAALVPGVPAGSDRCARSPHDARAIQRMPVWSPIFRKAGGKQWPCARRTPAHGTPVAPMGAQRQANVDVWPCLSNAMTSVLDRVWRFHARRPCRHSGHRDAVNIGTFPEQILDDVGGNMAFDRVAAHRPGVTGAQARPVLCRAPASCRRCRPHGR